MTGKILLSSHLWRLKQRNQRFAVRKWLPRKPELGFRIRGLSKACRVGNEGARDMFHKDDVDTVKDTHSQDPKLTMPQVRLSLGPASHKSCLPFVPRQAAVISRADLILCKRWIHWVLIRGPRECSHEPHCAPPPALPPFLLPSCLLSPR